MSALIVIYDNVYYISGGFMNDSQQEIYINLDDSGKLTSKEHVSVCGGLVFFSKKEKDKFITQYRSIVKDILLLDLL